MQQSGNLDNLVSKVEKLLGLFDQLDNKVGSIYRDAGGSGGNNVMSNSLGSVSNSVTQAGDDGGALGFGLQVAGDAFKTGLAQAGAISMMMPSVTDVVSREAGIYGAGVATGGIVNRTTLERQVRTGLGAGQNIANATAVVGGILTGRGLASNQAKFSEIVASTGNAARLLNMQNDVAASAMESLTAGQQSAQMLQTYGIFTANPLTGEEYSQTEIFGQLSGRLTQGQIGNMSTEELLTDIRRGALGSNIRNSGLDAAQQELFKTYLIAQTQGVNLDLSDTASVNEYGRKLEQQGYENPLLAFQELTAKDDEMRETATDPYLQGIRGATDALVQLKNFTRDNLIPTFGQLKATIDSFTGDQTGAGAVGFAGATVSGFFKQVGNLLGFVTGVDDAIPFLGGSGSNLPSTKVASGYRTIGSSGEGGGGYRSSSAGAGSMMRGEGGSGSADSGRTSPDTAGNQGGSGAPEPFKLRKPVPGKIRATFNQKESSFTAGKIVWPDGHRGVDFDAAEGTPIAAAANGYATVHSSSGFGNFVKIKHENGMYTFYAHMSKVAIREKNVSKGELIGYVGTTGRSSGPHLHFALSKKDSTAHPHVIDPVPYFEGGAGGLAEGAGGASGDTASNQGSTSGTGAASYASGSSTSAPATAGGTLTSGELSESGRAVVDDTNITASGMDSGTDSLSASSSASSFNLPSPHSKAAHYKGEGGSGYNPVSNIYTPSNLAGPMGKSSAVGKSTTNQVTINLSIAQASEEEARKFAALVKEKLEDEKLVSQMGRR